MSVLYPTEYLLTPSPATALRIGLTLGEGWEDRGGEGKVVRKIEGDNDGIYWYFEIVTPRFLLYVCFIKRRDPAVSEDSISRVRAGVTVQKYQ